MRHILNAAMMMVLAGCSYKSDQSGLAVALMRTELCREVHNVWLITADTSDLKFYFYVPADRISIYELQPFENYTPGARQPVWQGDVGEKGVRIARFDGKRDRMFSKFQIVESATGTPIGCPRYVSDIAGIPVRDFDFKWPESIKGLQVQMVDDAIELGVKYAGYNVMISQVIDWSGKSDVFAEIDGERIPIDMNYIGGLDKAFKQMTNAGINITIILLNGVPRKPDPNNPFIHPATDLEHAPFNLGAFNMTGAKGIRYYRAALGFLAERYSRPDCVFGHVSGYIIGNEVQAHWEWYNIGKMPLDEFIEHYGPALRIADLTARSIHSKIRTYVSMEHHWNEAIRDDPLTAFRGKEFLEKLNAWAKRGGDFPWHVAFHPYPENLFDPRFWRDRQAALSFDTPKITFKNIEILPAFLKRDAFLHRGEPRRIILSEQGFHTPDGPEGQKIQAAAYALAYHKLRNIPEIDSFILHRHVDHRQEGGLKLGLWTWAKDSICSPGERKLSYEVFKKADTPEWEKAFEFALPVIGIKSWDEALPSASIEATPDPTPEITIIKDGASDYRIVIPSKPEPSEEYAARELQHFLEEMSGVKLPITDEWSARSGTPSIIIGRCDTMLNDDDRKAIGGLREDGILIRTRPDPMRTSWIEVAGEQRDVILSGKDARGRLYSIYVLLERYLGVRFLARDCIIVPKRTTVALPTIDYAYSPPFMYRETLYFDSFPMEIAARQRLNGPATKCDETSGGKIAFHPYVHSFCKLVPPEKYYDEHPEYFSLVGGKRTRETIHGQLCLSNPDVLSIATEQVMKWIEENPGVPIFDVSQNDGNGSCECDKCMAIVGEEGSQHGPILRFVNAIAEKVEEKYPDKWVETLAYAYAMKPPAKTRPRKNVIIRLCHAGCYFHGFEKCGLGANLTQYIAEWSGLTRRIFIWHYATNFAHYIAPNQNLDALARDIKYYAAHGVNGLMIQGNYQGPGGELAELRQYLASQLMWNPERDPGMIRLEFCNGYYGASANDVLDYLSLLDDCAKEPEVHAFGAWDPKNTVPQRLVHDGLEILTRARTRAKDSETANRVGRLLLPLWYMQLTYPADYGLDPKDAGTILADFRRIVESCGITHVCEGGAGMAGWLTQMEAKFADAPESLILDLYMNLGRAKLENCMDWRPETIRSGDKTLLSIFHHPKAGSPADATFEIELPKVEHSAKIILRFGTGFTGPTDDGARFAILIDGRQEWEHTQKEQPPIAHELDLTKMAGKKIALTLRVDALGNEKHDWANWTRPQIMLEK
ncbi:MAG TPA: DUF4838 domain-containing protein [Candidatus Brocadiia bacterium]|nr:DUF4838 domain-containing protein [Candidatus Brocadiia bacterium]